MIRHLLLYYIKYCINIFNFKASQLFNKKANNTDTFFWYCQNKKKTEMSITDPIFCKIFIKIQMEELVSNIYDYNLLSNSIKIEMKEVLSWGNKNNLIFFRRYGLIASNLTTFNDAFAQKFLRDVETRFTDNYNRFFSNKHNFREFMLFFNRKESIAKKYKLNSINFYMLNLFIFKIFCNKLDIKIIFFNSNEPVYRNDLFYAKVLLNAQSNFCINLYTKHYVFLKTNTNNFFYNVWNNFLPKTKFNFFIKKTSKSFMTITNRMNFKHFFKKMFTQFDNNKEFFFKKLKIFHEKIKLIDRKKISKNLKYFYITVIRTKLNFNAFIFKEKKVNLWDIHEKRSKLMSEINKKFYSRIKSTHEYEEFYSSLETNFKVDEKNKINYFLDYILEFLRKNKIFNKSRSSRMRQLYRTGVYLCIWINIIMIFGLYGTFYRISINFNYIWFICFVFFFIFLFNKIIKFNTWNPFYIIFEIKFYFNMLKILLNNFSEDFNSYYNVNLSKHMEKVKKKYFFYFFSILPVLYEYFALKEKDLLLKKFQQIFFKVKDWSAINKTLNLEKSLFRFLVLIDFIITTIIFLFKYIHDIYEVEMILRNYSAYISYINTKIRWYKSYVFDTKLLHKLFIVYALKINNLHEDYSTLTKLTLWVELKIVLFYTIILFNMCVLGFEFNLNCYSVHDILTLTSEEYLLLIFKDLFEIFYFIVWFCLWS